MKWVLPILIVVVLVSCGVISPRFHNTSFSYTTPKGQFSHPIKVPPGFLRMERADDELGNQGVMYIYNTARFFIIYARDTASETMPIDYSVNQPLPHVTGARVYKGMHEDGRYWRLIRHPHLRVGYQQVAPGQEVLFDSAANFTAKQLMQ